MTPTQFEEYIERIPFSGCWVWLRGGANGYGRTTHNGIEDYAHRISYALYKGPIPSGLFICHTCSVKLCVNPAHLYAGTHIDNVADAVANHEYFPPNASKTHCIREHILSGENIRINKSGSRVCKTCERERWQERSDRLKANHG